MTFIGAPRGRPANRFLRQVIGAGPVRSTEYSNRTEVFHLFARSVYRAIGQEDNRNRRRRPVFSIKAKLMSLDFVLAHQDYQFLATEEVKLDYFCGKLGITQSALPGKTYRSSIAPEESRRYFVEKCPIFLVLTASCTTPAFCYVDEGVLSTSGFRTFLNRYRRLFLALRRFRLVYIAAESVSFRSAKRTFDRFLESLRKPDSDKQNGALGEYFRLRRLLETRQYQRLDKANLDRLCYLSNRFQHPRTEVKFQEWSEEVTAAEQFGPVEAAFGSYLLPHSYDIFSWQKQPNSRG